MMNRSKVVGVLALVASALLRSPASDAEVGVTATSIRIGMVAPLTTSFAFGSLPLLCARTIYKSVDDAGGINGRKIEPSVVDYACDPYQAIADTKGLISQDQLFSIHGTTMTFLFAVPVMQAVATYLIPLMIGARSIAFPRMNAYAYWMFLFGGLTLYTAFTLGAGPRPGWLSYAPRSGPDCSTGKGIASGRI